MYVHSTVHLHDIGVHYQHSVKVTAEDTAHCPADRAFARSVDEHLPHLGITLCTGELRVLSHKRQQAISIANK